MTSPARPPRRHRPVIRGTIDPLLDERLRQRAETEGRAISRVMEAALRLYLDAPAVSLAPDRNPAP
jgi:hypothetical protein